ncbi:hypothetical protein F503_01430 [Ophiostoma piceae UAMH 11346]|uniref:BZIP domain-containing protein n=1 Tax=Ophiostoma piceae (strain UAMH 11346) TaxID=1262450 RepID=S3BY70_OPHP1|nr:hypothetical protein F503_01430 [Ophiostoma piceae UAMH 11346]
MPRDLAAAERKRLRDRVAQQNLRNRRQQYIQELEEKAKRCQERHGGGDGVEGGPDKDRLWIKIRQLQDENSALKERHRKLRTIMQSMRGVLEDEIDDDDRHTESSSRRGHAEAGDHNGDTFSSRDGLEGSNSQMSVDDSLPVGDDDTSPSLLSQQSSLVSSTPTVHRPAVKPTTTGAELTPWQDEGVGTPGDEATIMTPFPTYTPLPNTPPETAYSPLLDSRLWNFMDLWTNHNNMDNLLSGDMTEAASAAAASTLSSINDTVRVVPRDEPPAWSVIPMRVSSTADRDYQPWDRDMGAILDAADEPSPLELVFGSSTNFLANEVQVTLKHFFASAPERLSIGIMIYSFVKWRTKPSPERYGRLPEFVRLVPEQAKMSHSGCLDIILWGQLRANIIRNHAKYDVDKVMRKYCSSLRLRWSRDRDMLIPIKDNAARGDEPKETHRLNPDFYARYTDLSNWGLTSDFQRAYPELLEGMDWASICVDGA